MFSCPSSTPPHTKLPTQGSYMSLDMRACDAYLLLATLRSATNTAKISSEDKQLIYTAEKLKNIRMCILMTDYPKLVAETLGTDMSMINSAGLEEILLVKKAIDFFENLKSVSNQLKSGRLLGSPGHLDIHALSTYQLNDSLCRFDFDACTKTVRRFLACAASTRDLRSAVKAARWCTGELISLLCGKIKALKMASSSSTSYSNRSLADSGTAPTVSSSFESPMAIATFKPYFIVPFDYECEMFGLSTRAKNASRRTGSLSPSEQEPYSAAARGASDSDSMRRNRSSSSDSTMMGISSEGDLPTGAEFTAELGGVPSGVGDALIEVLYTDQPGKNIYISSVFSDSSLDPLGVPRLLSSLQHIVAEVESEVLLIRDEAYDRVCCSMLQQALQYKSASNMSSSNTQQHGSTMRGTVTSDARRSFIIGTHAAADLSEDQPVELDTAIAVTELFGCKSVESNRLLQCGLFMRELRTSVASGNNHETLAILKKVNELKAANLFDPIVVAEIDDIFKAICASNFKAEMYRSLGFGGSSTLEATSTLSSSNGRIGIDDDDYGDDDCDIRDGDHDDDNSVHRDVENMQENDDSGDNNEGLDESGDERQEKRIRRRRRVERAHSSSIKAILRNVAAVKGLDEESNLLMYVEVKPFCSFC